MEQLLLVIVLFRTDRTRFYLCITGGNFEAKKQTNKQTRLTGEGILIDKDVD